jgi:hypothetical protein
LPRSASVRNDCASATANLQFIPIGIFKEECVITWAVFRPDLGAFQVSATGFTDNFSDAVDLFARLRPECDSRIIWAMIRLFFEAKEFRGFAGAVFFKTTPLLRAFIESKSNCRQNLSEKFLRPRPISDTQVDVIKETSLQDWNCGAITATGPRAVVSSFLIQPELGALPRCGLAVLLR